MIILNSVEYFKSLKALFLVCVEEARCLLFHYNAETEHAGCGVAASGG